MNTLEAATLRPASNRGSISLLPSLDRSGNALDALQTVAATSTRLAGQPAPAAGRSSTRPAGESVIAGGGLGRTSRSRHLRCPRGRAN